MTTAKVGCDHPDRLNMNLDWSKAMSREDYPTLDFVRQCLREEDGRLFWLQRPREHFATFRCWRVWNARFANKEAGYCSNKDGDLRWLVCLQYIMLRRYQIIWLLHTGNWPGNLDHKNRNSLDDRIENLRPANQSQNMANSRLSSNNTSGFKGVRWTKKTKKWQAVIKVNYRNIYLGQFEDPAEAHAAYLDAAKRYFGDFACGG